MSRIWYAVVAALLLLSGMGGLAMSDHAEASFGPYSDCRSVGAVVTPNPVAQGSTFQVIATGNCPQYDPATHQVTQVAQFKVTIINSQSVIVYTTPYESPDPNPSGTDTAKKTFTITASFPPGSYTVIVTAKRFDTGFETNAPPVQLTVQ